MAKSWEELGKRVMAARRQMGLTQVELAEALQVDRTVITKIEGGLRTVDTLELSRLSKALRRPIGWFVREPSPSVISRRADREDVIRSEDIQLEEIAQDLEQLIELGVLSNESRPGTVVWSPELCSMSSNEVAISTPLCPTSRRCPGWRPYPSTR